MDTTKQKEQLAKVETRIAELVNKQRDTERRLARETENVKRAEAERARLVSDLAGADGEASGRIHKSLDAADGQLRTAQRMAESFKKLLDTITAEMTGLNNERIRLSQAIAQEENAAAFEAWKVHLQQARADVEEKCAAARLALAALDSLCARGGEKFRGIAYNIASEMFETLLIKEANLEQHGWKISTPAYRADAIVHIRPLIRR